MSCRALIVMAAAVGLAAPPVLAQESTPVMDITRKADMQTVEGPADYFTGRATITGQFQRPAPSRVSGALVCGSSPARARPDTPTRWARP